MENDPAAVVAGLRWSRESLCGVLVEALFQQGLLTEAQRAEVRAVLSIDGAEGERKSARPRPALTRRAQP